MSFQTQCLEFFVTQQLGGAQRNPGFSIDPSDEDYVRPTEENLYQFTVENLGVVDLSFLSGSPSVGIRFVPWVWVDAPAAPAGVGAVDVVDSVSLTRLRTAFFAPLATRYFTGGIRVPQGASLRFNDVWTVPAGGRPIRLRILAIPAANTLQWAQMHQAFCCLEEPPAIEEGGPPA